MDWDEPETHESYKFDGEVWSIETNRLALSTFRQEFPQGNLQWTIGLDFEKTQELGWFALNVQYLGETIEWLIHAISMQDSKQIPSQRVELLEGCLDASNAIWKLVEEFVQLGQDSVAIRAAVVEHYHLVSKIISANSN